jgi:hypothetical protein
MIESIDPCESLALLSPPNVLFVRIEKKPETRRKKKEKKRKLHVVAGFSTSEEPSKCTTYQVVTTFGSQWRERRGGQGQLRSQD